MTPTQFVGRFILEAETRPYLSAVLILRNYKEIRALFDEILNRHAVVPRPLRLVLLTGEMKHANGARLRVRAVENEEDMYRIAGMATQLLGVSKYCPRRVHQYTQSILRSPVVGDRCDRIVIG